MAGILGAKKKPTVSDMFLVVRRDLEVLLSDCPCIERAWPARTGLAEAVTRAMPRAFDRNSSLEIIIAFLNAYLNSFSQATAFDLAQRTKFWLAVCAEVFRSRCSWCE